MAERRTVCRSLGGDVGIGLHEAVGKDPVVVRWQLDDLGRGRSIGRRLLARRVINPFSTPGAESFAEARAGVWRDGVRILVVAPVSVDSLATLLEKLR